MLPFRNDSGGTGGLPISHRTVETTGAGLGGQKCGMLLAAGDQPEPRPRIQVLKDVWLPDALGPGCWRDLGQAQVLELSLGPLTLRPIGTFQVRGKLPQPGNA